jgi:hypothetical protein
LCHSMAMPAIDAVDAQEFRKPISSSREQWPASVRFVASEAGAEAGVYFRKPSAGLALTDVFWYDYIKMSDLPRATGAQAARLRQRTFVLTERYDLPEALLPGSLVLSHTRCGKPTCHCVEDEGHPAWSLTFMVDGRKRVEHIPRDWVDEVQRQVTAGRAFQDAVRAVLAANAQLLALARQQPRPARRRPGRDHHHRRATGGGARGPHRSGRHRARRTDPAA